MAGNTDNISVNETLYETDGSGNTATLTGTLSVTDTGSYSNNPYTGSLTFKTSANNPVDETDTFGISGEAAMIYAGNYEINYTSPLGDTGMIAYSGGDIVSTLNSSDSVATYNNPYGDSYSTQAQPVCFCTGTLIRTAAGDVAVEKLKVGDQAITASGSLRPIRWIGHRTLDCAAQARPSDCWPIRILAGAFGKSLPQRDLFLSPGHPVLVGEHLVPIMCLINGTSIARMPVKVVAYWHVELDGHDLLLAEGLPAESYLDFGNRPFFEDGATHALIDPDFVPPGLNGRCLPVAVEGPIIDAERRRLDAVFATSLAGACGWSTSDHVAVW